MKAEKSLNLLILPVVFFLGLMVSFNQGHKKLNTKETIVKPKFIKYIEPFWKQN